MSEIDWTNYVDPSQYAPPGGFLQRGGQQHTTSGGSMPASLISRFAPGGGIVPYRTPGIVPTMTGPAGLVDIIVGGIDLLGKLGVPPQLPGMPGIPMPRLPSLGQMGLLGPPRKGRRMNVCNMKALTRALRRARGFEKKARRVLRVTTGKSAKVTFKRKKTCR